ncbi:MAG: glycine--tRNA ligase [Thermoprotei archaeon]|nr:MAG: glycine--tRNA ligase [Thermoprotei archaeon]
MSKYEKVIELAKRRGFFWQAVEIYGGVRGFLDFGPLGVALKLNIMEKWRKFFISQHQDFIVEIETPIIMPEVVFKASGHLEHFTDYIVECTACGRKYRADHLIEEKTGMKDLERLSAEELTKIIRERNIRCPECNGELSDVRKFNLLFRTIIGPYSHNVGYARPETAQGMFLTFKRIYEIMRRKLPLGIAQIGKVLRNEISPRQGPIRLREFTIMELELFFDPEEPNCFLINKVIDDKIRVRRANSDKPIEITIGEALEEGIISTEWLAYFMAVGQRFVNSLGIPMTKQIFVEKAPEELAHYSVQTFDQCIELSRWGLVEVAGYAYRTDYDLTRHMKFSGVDLRAFKEYKKPMIRVRKVIKPLLNVMGPILRERTKEIVAKLKAMDSQYVIKELEEKGYVEINGIKITADMIKIEEEKVKETGKRFIPHVAEPSFGLERLVYATLEYAYTEKEGRIVLKLPPDIAPISIAVFPLIQHEGMIRKAKEIYDMLVSEGFSVIYDESGSIGRRYARADEIGVPLAVTVDGLTLENNTVTLRDRDTWNQVRVHVDEIPEILRRFLRGEISFKDLERRYGVVREHATEGNREETKS